MAFIRTAVDPDGLRRACQIADATSITIYDADHPQYEGQQFVQAFVGDARGNETEFNLKDPEWDDFNEAIEREAEYHDETVKFVLDLGEPTVVTMKLAIENHYVEDGDVVKKTADVVAPPLPESEEEQEEWAEDYLFPHTGTGRTEGDSAYFVTITESSDPALVGKEFEWGT